MAPGRTKAAVGSPFLAKCRLAMYASVIAFQAWLARRIDQALR